MPTIQNVIEKVQELIDAHNETVEEEKLLAGTTVGTKNPDGHTDLFNPTEKQFQKIANEASCLQRIEMKIWDYMQTPMPKRDCVEVAMEIFKDVERTIKKKI